MATLAAEDPPNPAPTGKSLTTESLTAGFPAVRRWAAMRGSAEGGT